MRRAALHQSVAFDVEVNTPDGKGGQDRTWSEVHVCRAEFRYQRGEEAEIDGGLTGTARFKVRVRSCPEALALTADHRMRDIDRDVAYNVREIDGITDRQWVWLIVESGRAI